MAIQDVEIGQGFRVVDRALFGQATRVWVIQRLFIGVDGQRYGVLVSADAARATKTLAVSVLMDRRRFVPVAGMRAA